MMDRRRGLIGSEGLKFNQLIQNGNFEDVSVWEPNRVSYTVGNNIASITKLVQNVYSYISQSHLDSPAGNKVYFACEEMFERGNEALLVTLGGSAFTSPDALLVNSVANEWVKNEGIRTVARSGFLSIYTRNIMVGEVLFVKNVMLIDLTYMYGAGNEPTTVEQVYEDCEKLGHPLTEYQPYTPKM